MSVPPVRTPEERQAALVLALQDRRARALIKDAVSAGTTTVADVLAAVPADKKVTGRIKVVDLIEAVKGIGPVKAAEHLTAAGVNPEDRLDQLGSHQIAALSAAFA